MPPVLKRWRHADHFMLLLLLAILAYGLALVYSATFPYASGEAVAFSGFVKRQMAYAGVGLLLMALVASLDYRLLRAAAYVIYGATLLLLVVVLITGHGQAEYGSQRWIDL